MSVSIEVRSLSLGDVSVETRQPPTVRRWDLEAEREAIAEALEEAAAKVRRAYEIPTGGTQ